MAIVFYMDEHIPRPITVGLRARGVDVLTVQEDNRRGEADPLLLERATELERVMFAFDADMLREATRCQRAGQPFSGLVFAHPTRITVGNCIRDLELIAKAGEIEDLANLIIYLPI
jgi:predicted nuclease of predicted toxin-antitoxin system